MQKVFQYLVIVLMLGSFVNIGAEPIQCYKQMCHNYQSWVCSFAEPQKRNCDGKNDEGSHCFEYTDYIQYSAGCVEKGNIGEDEKAEVKKNGTLQKYEPEDNATQRFCNTPLCNNVLEGPTKFEVSKEELGQPMY